MSETLKQIKVNGKVITEGEKYIHNSTGVTYTVTRHKHGVLKLDNGILSVGITESKVKLITKIK